MVGLASFLKANFQATKFRATTISILWRSGGEFPRSSEIVSGAYYSAWALATWLGQESLGVQKTAAKKPMPGHGWSGSAA